MTASLGRLDVLLAGLAALALCTGRVAVWRVEAQEANACCRTAPALPEPCAAPAGTGAHAFDALSDACGAPADARGASLLAR